VMRFGEQAIQRSTEAYRTATSPWWSLCCRRVLHQPPRARDRPDGAGHARMEQPTAVDLRFILSVIRINADLERVGDQA